MALIVDAEVVRKRMAASSVEEVVRAIETAIESGTVHLEGVLGTPFARATVVDTFHVQWTMEFSGRKTQQLQLSAGLLASDPSSIVVAASLAALADSPTQLLGELDVLVDREKGLVTIERDLSGMYVRVSYEAGFTQLASGEVAVYQGVPAWLQEAGVVAAYLQAEMNPSIRAYVAQSLDGGPSPGTIASQLDAVIARHLRYAPIALSPIHTTRVEA